VKAGWKTRPLAEVCRLINGKAYKKAELLESGPYPVLRVGNFFTSDHWYYSDLELDDEKYCDEGDLLYAWSASFGPRIWQGEKSIYHYHIWKVVPDAAQLDKKFLYHFFEWDKELIKKEHGAGATMIHVSKGSMEARKISFPPHEEQRRIVAILDEAFEGLSRARANAEANLESARELFGSVLSDVFSNAPAHWTQSNLGSTCNFIGGSQPPKSEFRYSSGDGLVRLIQIRDYKSDKHLVFVPQKLARRFFDQDDVMLGRYGPPLFQILRGLAGAYNVALMKAEPNANLISKDFLFYFLKNERILRYIIEASSRAAGQIGLNKATLEPYPIAFPDKDEQQTIVGRLELIEQQCDLLIEEYSEKLKVLEEVRQSLLQKAFAGELTVKEFA